MLEWFWSGPELFPIQGDLGGLGSGAADGEEAAIGELDFQEEDELGEQLGFAPEEVILFHLLEEVEIKDVDEEGLAEIMADLGIVLRVADVGEDDIQSVPEMDVRWPVCKVMQAA